MSSGLAAGFALDRQWHWLRGETETTKKPALLLLARILNAASAPWALIGGLAVQVHHPDPRTTIDIDVGVLSRASIPSAELTAAGFRRSGSEKWISSDGTPLQVSDDPALANAITAAGEVIVDGVLLRVIGAVDLLHEKIRAGSDPARRRSKRLQDLADAEALIEAYPDLKQQLRPDEREVLERLPE